MRQRPLTMSQRALLAISLILITAGASVYWHQVLVGSPKPPSAIHALLK